MHTHRTTLTWLAGGLASGALLLALFSGDPAGAGPRSSDRSSAASVESVTTVHTSSTSTAKKDDDDEPAKNLKVLPASTKPEEIHRIMRTFSRSLGVRCGFCHVVKEGKPGERPTADFASDAKREKLNAREMMKMTRAINESYLQKIDHSFEEITCVSCHHGSVRPMISTDSLPRPASMGKPNGEKHEEHPEKH